MSRKYSKSKATCRWIGGLDAFKAFATHEGITQSAKHIKPLHWYIACRLVLEGGFHPDNVTPRPPFIVESKKVRGQIRHFLIHDPNKGGAGEQVILGGLKTKNVDVVVNLPTLGPVMAVSCKGVTKAFRNLTNRMEETIGECTNLHITYPAMVIGYFAILRANRTIQDALEAPDVETDRDVPDEEEISAKPPSPGSKQAADIAANDIAIQSNEVVESIQRFHSALCEMTGRRGIRDEISRYEAITLSLIEPRGLNAGNVFSDFPLATSALRLEHFFQTLYLRYEERFVYGAPLLADRGITLRLDWDAESPAFNPSAGVPTLDFTPRIAPA
jgi:hypothetical protein